MTSALADIAAIRDDAARTEAKLNKIGSDMEVLKDDVHEMCGVIQFLKWAIPLAIAASGLIVALLKK